MRYFYAVNSLIADSKPKVILLMGPTASGKTQLAVNVAKEINAEVISVDSALVFRGMDIGTAKPDMDERAGIKHHLIDIIDPSQHFSAGQFAEQANMLIREITQRGKAVILVGGTMLYFHVLLEGIAELPAANEAIRKEIDELAQRRGWAYVHRQLQEVDAVAAARIHPNDPQRIQRALEIYKVSGRNQTAWLKSQKAIDLSFVPLKFSISPAERQTLHNKIEERFDLMLEQGFEEEVRVLFKRQDLHVNLPAIRAVGYRQMWAYLSGEYNFNTMREKAIIATRQLAKRQFTWLRRQTNVMGLETGDNAGLKNILAIINETADINNHPLQK